MTDLVQGDLDLALEEGREALEAVVLLHQEF